MQGLVEHQPGPAWQWLRFYHFKARLGDTVQQAALLDPFSALTASARADPRSDLQVMDR
jgi:hypothetical protein